MGKVVEINAETNEVVEREETNAEAIDRAKLKSEYEAQNALQEAAKEAKVSAIAKLETLGLTEDEAKAIIG